MFRDIIEMESVPSGISNTKCMPELINSSIFSSFISAKI
jgi:hypothetical protein